MRWRHAPSFLGPHDIVRTVALQCEIAVVQYDKPTTEAACDLNLAAARGGPRPHVAGPATLVAGPGPLVPGLGP
eukprot:4766127-Prorocentrum_lima.AAC.1